MTGGGPSRSSSSPQENEEFVRRLIEAVKGQPCLYNPSHEHYGNKHSSAQFRCRVWQKLCVDLGFNEDAHALQMQWKRIRDRYVRERRKRRSANSCDTTPHQEGSSGRERHPSGGSTCSTSSGSTNSVASRHYEMMRWIEPYLVDIPPNNNGQSNNNVAVGSPANGASQSQQQPHAVSNSEQLQGQNGNMVSIVVTTSGSDEPVTYYMNQSDIHSGQPAAVNSSAEGVMMNTYQHHPSQQPQQQTSSQSQHDYAAQSRNTMPNGSSGASKSAAGPSSTTGSPCSSTTSSEIDVGSVPSFAGQQQSQQQVPQHQPNMVVLTSVPQQQRQAPPQHILYTKNEPQPRIGQPVQTADGSVVTVTARGTAPIVKKDVNIRTNDGGTVTMIIDPTTFYQHGSQKMYRLVNVSELNSDMVPLTTSTMGPSTSEIKVVGGPPRRKRVAAVSVQGMPNGRGQLGDDLILDDGISEKTVTIDQSSPSPLGADRIMLDHHPGVSGNSNMMVSHHSVQQVHHQQHPGTSQQHTLNTGGHHGSVSHHMGHPVGAQISTVTVRQPQQGSQRFVQQPVSVQQQPQYTVLTSQPVHSQHDADLAFANSIASHLSRLNDDEKAVAKMNIQRILMDARFGLGATARMIHDEELNEAAANSAAAHELVPQQQHVDTSSRR